MAEDLGGNALFNPTSLATAPLILSDPAKAFAALVRPDVAAPATPPSALPSAPSVTPGPFAAHAAASFAPSGPPPGSPGPAPSFPALAPQTGLPYRPATFFGGLHPFALYGAPVGMLGGMGGMGSGMGGGLLAALMRSNPMLLAALLAHVRGTEGPTAGRFAV